jgi:hypothetical protein
VWLIPYDGWSQFPKPDYVFAEGKSLFHFTRELFIAEKTSEPAKQDKNKTTKCVIKEQNKKPGNAILFSYP